VAEVRWQIVSLEILALPAALTLSGMPGTNDTTTMVVLASAATPIAQSDLRTNLPTECNVMPL
jgi:hypothetical protein